ncbi:hypothetical protein MTO96_012142 [Rhipicephalus appendiculatus]
MPALEASPIEHATFALRALLLARLLCRIPGVYRVFLTQRASRERLFAMPAGLFLEAKLCSHFRLGTAEQTRTLLLRGLRRHRGHARKDLNVWFAVGKLDFESGNL